MLAQNVLDQDSDGDGFTTLDEWHGQDRSDTTRNRIRRIGRSSYLEAFRAHPVPPAFRRAQRDRSRSTRVDSMRPRSS